MPTPRFASCAPEVIRRAWNDVREELRAHSRARAVVTVHCAAVLSCRWVGRGGAITGRRALAWIAAHLHLDAASAVSTY